MKHNWIQKTQQKVLLQEMKRTGTIFGLEKQAMTEG